MSRYVIRRLGFLFLTLLLTSIIVFAATQVIPGDVARVILGREAGEVALESLREELGLNDPLPVQYLRWLGSILRGDWGESFSTGIEVRPLVEHDGVADEEGAEAPPLGGAVHHGRQHQRRQRYRKC